LGGLVVFGVFLYVGLAVWYEDSKASFDSEAAKIAERGEPLWFADLEPAPTSTDEDAAPLVLQAISLLVKPSPGFDDLVQPAAPITPGHYVPIEMTLAANRPALDLLAQAYGKSHCRFPYDYSTNQTLGIVLDHVQKCREISRLLVGDVLQSLAYGDRDRAAAAIVENLELGELLREEPFIISQLVRSAISASAIQSLQNMLARSTLTAEQFASIDEHLDRMATNFSLRRTIAAERALLLTAMQHLDENVSLLDSGLSTQAAKFDPNHW
jgi:hypothetical protein